MATIIPKHATSSAASHDIKKPSRPEISSKNLAETLSTLKVDPNKGLSTDEVAARLKLDGYNEVAEESEHPIRQFLGKFWGISAWMLELILVLSAILKNYADLALVSALLIINATLSFLQERRAVGVVQALRKRLQVSARVLRDSKWSVIQSRELVPGDIVRVRPGDIIPADLKLISGTLSIDQSALTGESKNVDKATEDVLSSGSIVRRGEANGVVILTGAKTYFGRTTELVQQAKPKLHIEAVVSKLVRWLFAIVGRERLGGCLTPHPRYCCGRRHDALHYLWPHLHTGYIRGGRVSLASLCERRTRNHDGLDLWSRYSLW